MNFVRLCQTCRQRWRPKSLLPSSISQRRAMSINLQSGTSLSQHEDWSKFQLDHATDKLWFEHYSQYGSNQTRDSVWRPHHSLHKPPSPGELTLSALLASGAHLGHSTSLLNPNFMPYTYGTRAGITIIDLDHTVPMLRRAANLTRAIAAAGGTVVFVGTRPDIRPAVKKAAERMDNQGYYVSEKWLPGTLTNRIHHFGAQAVQSTKIIPDLVILLNPLANMPAIRECAIEHVPTIGIIDSNADPRIVMYAVPGNDESTRTAELVAGVLSIAGREGIEIKKSKERQERLRLKQEREANQTESAQRLQRIRHRIAAEHDETL